MACYCWKSNLLTFKIFFLTKYKYQKLDQIVYFCSFWASSHVSSIFYILHKSLMYQSSHSSTTQNRLCIFFFISILSKSSINGSIKKQTILVFTGLRFPKRNSITKQVFLLAVPVKLACEFSQTCISAALFWSFEMESSWQVKQQLPGFPKEMGNKSEDDITHCLL